MKNPLKNLAWKKGNLFQHVKKIENELKKVQMEVEANPNRKEVKMKLSNVLQEYNEAINDVEKLLAQKEAIFGIGNDKAPGPDGYTAKFFKTSWDIVGGNVCGAVKEFFKSNNLLGGSAFALGRLIQDNLLLTQELLKGYNRKIRQKRCALKIDIAKAYDILDLILTQLCFANDLLMLCNGDHVSVEVLKDGIMEFSKESGLVLNMHKSTIFIGSVKENEKQRILEVMSFAVGTLPMKYLGVPLITKNIGVTKCNQLVDRVKLKVNDWKNKTLSYAEDSDSGTWKAILNLRSMIRKNVWKKIWDGRSTNIWSNNGCNEDPLSETIPFRSRYEARVDEKANVVVMIVNGEWASPNEWKNQFMCINEIKVHVLEDRKKDCIV
ncbi:hypothetical protein Tco_1170623 [Tanacetum coccineum]